MFVNGCGYTFTLDGQKSWWGVIGGVPPSVRPTRTKLDYYYGNIIYQEFSSATAGVMNTVSGFFSGTGEEKMDPDKSVGFAYDGVQPT